MKIVYLIDDFPPEKVTSSGILTLNIARKMQAKGHQIWIITVTQNPALTGQSDYQGLAVIKIYSDYHERWRAYLSLYNPQIISHLKKILAEIKPDVCHFQHIHYYISYHSIKIAQRYCHNLFLTAHDAMLFSYYKIWPKNGSCVYKMDVWTKFKQSGKRFNPLRDIVIRHCIKSLKKIFCVSELQRQAMLINGIKNVSRIYNGIDLADWQFRTGENEEFINRFQLSGKKVVFFGGRLSGAKGGEVIVKSMEKVISKDPRAVLLVAGFNDEFAKNMLKLSKQLKLDDNFILTGWLNRREIKKAFYTADVCVTPSLCCDFFPTFNLEAGAAKKPVVGTCFGGTPEIIIDGKTGYIVDPNNIQLMADKILDLLQNPQKSLAFGEANYRRVKENFSLDQQVDKILEYYQSVFND